MKTIQALKMESTKAMYRSVFDHFNAPQDIVLELKDCVFVRRVWRNPSGHFGWGKWERIG
jgi:hypothetical protein